MKHIKLFLCLFLIILVFFVSSIMIFYFFVYKENTIENKNNNDTESEPPLSPTVIIDAGHGGEDGGAIGTNGAYEKDINLEIAKKLKSKLDAIGVPCVMTRETDILLYDRNVDYEGKKKKLDLQARKEFAEKYDNAIFISIHQNSYPKEKYDGLQIYYSPNNPASRELALMIENDVKESLQPNNNRASKEADSSIYLLDNLLCPAILIECGFISNKQECQLLCDEEYQNKLCESITSGIVVFLNYK